MFNSIKLIDLFVVFQQYPHKVFYFFKVMFLLVIQEDYLSNTGTDFWSRSRSWTFLCCLLYIIDNLVWYFCKQLISGLHWSCSTNFLVSYLLCFNIIVASYFQNPKTCLGKWTRSNFKLILLLSRVINNEPLNHSIPIICLAAQLFRLSVFMFYTFKKKNDKVVFFVLFSLLLNVLLLIYHTTNKPFFILLNTPIHCFALFCFPFFFRSCVAAYLTIFSTSTITYTIYLVLYYYYVYSTTTTFSTNFQGALLRFRSCLLLGFSLKFFFTQTSGEGAPVRITKN